MGLAIALTVAASTVAVLGHLRRECRRRASIAHHYPLADRYRRPGWTDRP